jgi:hypothetical protein
MQNFQLLDWERTLMRTIYTRMLFVAAVMAVMALGVANIDPNACTFPWETAMIDPNACTFPWETVAIDPNACTFPWETA